MYYCYLLGTAGSGKTSATAAMMNYLGNLGVNAITVNLDAAVRKLPYKPDVDIRDYIDIDEIISNYALGPNGAMIASMDLTATKVDDLRDEVEYLRPEYVIVDTPGQIELFAYRSSGLLSAKGLSSEEVNASVFLVDPALAHSPQNYASIMLLGVSVMYRLQLPQLFAFSKSDLVDQEVIEQVIQWSEDPQRLVDELTLDRIGLQAELSFEVARLLNTMGSSGEVIPFSSQTSYNIDQLFGQLQTIWGISEDSFDIT